jgi:chorismate-pyruvate lyase
MWDQSTVQLAQVLSENDINWMTKPYRLADALVCVCEKLIVEVQFQGMGFYVEGEQDLLNINEDDCYVREVFLKGDEANLCFARTVMPIKTYQACQNEFDTLSSKLLGKSLLYSQGDGVTRSAFHYAAIDSLHPYFAKARVLGNQKLGARASVFCIDNEFPLLVTEVFLPNMPLFEVPLIIES